MQRFLKSFGAKEQHSGSEDAAVEDWELASGQMEGWTAFLLITSILSEHKRQLPVRHQDTQTQCCSYKEQKNLMENIYRIHQSF